MTVILMKQCSHNLRGGGGGGGGESIPEGQHEITWNASTLSHFDQRTNQCELEVQMIINLQNLANQLPDAFVDMGSRFQKDDMKSLGMHLHYPILINVLINVNWKFK